MSISTSWPDRNSRSAELYERARAVLPGGISRLQTLVDPFPIYAGRGEGATIVDVDGTRRLDMMNNFASLIHGHARAEVIDAATGAARNSSCFAMPARPRSPWPNCFAPASNRSTGCAFATAAPRL